MRLCRYIAAFSPPGLDTALRCIQDILRRAFQNLNEARLSISMFDLTSFSGGGCRPIGLWPMDLCYFPREQFILTKANLRLEAEILHVDRAVLRALTFVYKETKRDDDLTAGHSFSHACFALGREMPKSSAWRLLASERFIEGVSTHSKTHQCFLTCS